MPDLFSYTPPKILGDRDGQTFNRKRDGARLNKQAQDVFNVMSDGNWRTLHEIHTRTGHPEASISARLRDLRKAKFGEFTIQRLHMNKGLWIYRLVHETPSTSTARADSIDMSRIERIGDATLYLGDCRDILPTLGKVDAVVTDPPYGVKRDKGFEGFGGFGEKIARRRYEDDDWDSERPSQECFDLILRTTQWAIIFGGNFFSDLLPVGGHWIVWDKLNTMPTFGDCELAWTNLDRKSVKKVTIEYNGLLGKEENRFHPTQKPVSVMRWCINSLPKGCNTILDPFMGVGSSGVACARLGRKFIGIEIDPGYFDIACRRIEKAYAQPDLFIAPPAKPVQEALL